LYKSFFVMIFFNFILFYLGLIYYINFNLVIVLSVWLIVLSFNPSFYSFEIFIISLIITKLTPLFKSKKTKGYISLLNSILSFLIPFYFFIIEIIKKDEEKIPSININNNNEYKNSYSNPIKFENSRNENLKEKNLSKSNSISYLSENNNNSTKNILKEKNKKENSLSDSKNKNISSENLSNMNSEKEYLKFEIYENERWWMLVGWKKSLIRNEIPLWCKVNDNKNFCDLNMVFLPNDNNIKYKWNGEWKVEKTNNTDDNGWEYSSDFHSKFIKNKEGNYVRRRKWVRFAIRI